MKINDSELVERYNKGESGTRIAKDLGVSKNKIYRRLRKLDIRVRTNAEGNRKVWMSAEELTKRYVDDKQSGMKIAKALGVEQSTIFQALRRFGIRVRTSAEAHRSAHPGAEELIKRYETQSAYSIAKDLGVSHAIVYEWLKKLGVRLRSHAEANRISGYQRRKSGLA